jgi:hypothetical protein
LSKKIKIIFLNDYRFYDYNSSIHVGFLSKMQEKYDILEVGENSGHFKSHQEKVGVDDFNGVFQTFKPDFFLTYNSNGSTYGKRNFERFSWLNDIYRHFDVRKIHITTDHCRDAIEDCQNEWFEKMGITCALFRHQNYDQKKIKIPCVWLPFSVDKDLALKNNVPFRSKRNKISFVGSKEHCSYEPRRKALEFLKGKGLIVEPDGKIINDEYFNYLSKHIFGLTCGSTKRFFTAKYIEILASGAFLICSDTDGLEIIPDEYYIKYNHNNMSEFYEKYLSLVKDKKKLRDKTKSSRDFVLTKHCHKKRISQFDKIIKRYL